MLTCCLLSSLACLADRTRSRANSIVNKDADSTASAAHHDAAVSRDQATASKGEAQVRAGLDKILK